MNDNIELTLEKLNNKKKVLEIQWGRFKEDLIDGQLKIKDSTFTEYLEWLQKLDEVSKGNPIISQSYLFLNTYKTISENYYHNLKTVWAGIEDIIEEQEKMLREVAPKALSYDKFKEEYDDESIDDVLKDLSVKIDDKENVIEQLEDTKQRLVNALNHILFELKTNTELNLAKERINMVFKIYKIDAEVPISSIQVGAHHAPTPLGTSASLVPFAKSPFLEKEGFLDVQDPDEKKAGINSSLFAEAKERFINDVKAYFALPVKKRGNRLSLVNYVQGMILRDKIPKEEAEKLRNEARRLSDIIYKEIEADYENKADELNLPKDTEIET